MSNYCCDTCYWRLTGCKSTENYCEVYFPNDYDEDVCPPPEREYDPKTNCPWEKIGFSVVELKPQ